MTGHKPMSDALGAKLRERYTPAEVPPCRVCGRALRIQRASAGEMLWGCDGLESDPDNEGLLRRAPDWDVSNDHYRKSQFDQRPIGDPLVLRAADRITALTDRVEQLREALEEAERGLDAAARTINGGDDSLDALQIVRAKIAIRSTLGEEVRG